MKKPKKVKIDFSQPEEYQAPDRNDPNVFVDDSASELQKLQQEMKNRRQERENEEDEDGLVIKNRPVGFNRIKGLFKV